MKYDEEKKPRQGEEKPRHWETPKQEAPKQEAPKQKEVAPKGQEKHEKWGSEAKKGSGCQ